MMKHSTHGGILASFNGHAWYYVSEGHSQTCINIPFSHLRNNILFSLVCLFCVMELESGNTAEQLVGVLSPELCDSFSISPSGRLRIITYYVRAKEWISLRFLFHKYLIIPGYAYSFKRGPLEFMNSFLKWSLQIFEVFVGSQFSRLMKSIPFFCSALSEGKEKKLTFLSGGFLSEFWQPKTLHVLTITFT